MILLFLFVWREKGTFPFANSQQRQFFSSENQGFNTFTDLGLKFSVYFLNGGGGVLFFVCEARIALCEEWTRQELASAGCT